MPHARSTAATVPLLLLSMTFFAGCADDAPSEGVDPLNPDGGAPPPDGTPRGYTACGAATCQPGQYCFSGAHCTNGCLSDLNCADNQRCATEEMNPTCVNHAQDAGPGPDDPLSDCQAACDHFQSCGLPAAGAAGCRSDCAGLTPDQQRAVGGCRDRACGTDVLACLGVACLGDADCGSDGVTDTCVNYRCL